MASIRNTNQNTKIAAETAGFTLVEMMVSLAIFAVVSVVAAGALIKIMDANKKAQSIQSAITNLNFALETMSRELRNGSKYYCTATTELPYDGRGVTNNPCSIASTDVSSQVTLAFRSSNLTTDSSGNICTSPNAYNKAYAYRFIPDPSHPGYFKLQKAQQGSGCPSAPIDSADDFHDFISASNVTITGFLVRVLQDNATQPYPMAVIRILGYTGVNERSKTYFDIETAASSRLP